MLMNYTVLKEGHMSAFAHGMLDVLLGDDRLEEAGPAEGGQSTCDGYPVDVYEWPEYIRPIVVLKGDKDAAEDVRKAMRKGACTF